MLRTADAANIDAVICESKVIYITQMIRSRVLDVYLPNQVATGTTEELCISKEKHQFL
jgi:hypothetical protein